MPLRLRKVSYPAADGDPAYPVLVYFCFLCVSVVNVFLFVVVFIILC
jgi:hypothetical protein